MMISLPLKKVMPIMWLLSLRKRKTPFLSCLETDKLSPRQTPKKKTIIINKS